MSSKYLRTIFLSFYASSIYKDALNNGRGYGLKYLLIVTLLTSAIISAGWVWKIRQINPVQLADSIMEIIISEPELTFEENINRFLNILSQIPDISIKEGKLITEEARPYPITDPVSGNDVAVIDTTGRYKSLEGTDAALLLTETKLIARNEQNTEEKGPETVMYLSDISKHYDVNEESLNEALFIIGQIPLISLNNGKLLTQGDESYKIIDKKDLEIAQVGPDAKLDEKSMQPVIVINQDEIAYKTIFNKDGTYIKATDITEDKLFELIKSSIIYIKGIMLTGMPLVAFPFLVLTSFVFNVIMLLLYAFIGYSFIKIMKKGAFEYQQVMRIAAIAITPILIISVTLPHFIPSQGTIYFLITIGYLHHAIRSVTAE